MKQFYRLVILILVFAGLGSSALAAENPRVVFDTNFGKMIIELYPDDAPVTVDNFLSYVNSGFYDGLLFHRSETTGRQTTDGINIYTGSLDVLQAGWLYLKRDSLYIREPAKPPIINESYNGRSNTRGTISMARASAPDSATAQFFVNHQNNPELDRDYEYGDGFGYCVFGAVVEGQDVMDDIAQTHIGVSDFTSFFPFNPLVIIYTAYELPCELSYCSDFMVTGKIDLEDYALLASHWLDDSCGQTNDFCGGVDLDYSGSVDLIDLELFWAHWTRTAGFEPRFSDLFHDGTIDTTDLMFFIDGWLYSGCSQLNNYCERADINRDGVVNLVDYSLLAGHWLGSY